MVPYLSKTQLNFVYIQFYLSTPWWFINATESRNLYFLYNRHIYSDMQMQQLEKVQLCRIVLVLFMEQLLVFENEKVV